LTVHAGATEERTIHKSEPRSGDQPQRKKLLNNRRSFIGKIAKNLVEGDAMHRR
jgi:hypothetical protein